MSKNQKQLKDSILGRAKRKENFFINIVGTNGSGKTEFVKEIKRKINKVDNFRILYFPSELWISDQKDHQRKKTTTIADQLVDIINEIHGKIQYQTTAVADIEDVKNLIDECSTVKIKEDEYFKIDFKNIFDIKEQTIEEKILATGSVNDVNFSSGEGFYSLLNLSINIAKHPKTKRDNTIFIFDEPEKFLHPTLMKKVALLLFDLYYKEKVNIILSTHSPFFLNFIMEESIRNKVNIETYKFMNDDSILEVKLNNELNYRERKNIYESLFSENIFLVEGLKDYEFVSLMLKENFAKQYYLIIDCYGKLNVKKMHDYINKKFHINECFLFFDRDYYERNDFRISDHASKKKIGFERAKKEIESKRKSSADNIRKNLANYPFYYEFIDDLEEEIRDHKRNKHDMTYITMDNIKKMDNYELIKSKLDAYFKREK
ncbi:MAG: ATP-dependent nuclease [Mycoplasmoidaceae bacterium]